MEWQQLLMKIKNNNNMIKFSLLTEHEMYLRAYKQMGK